MIVLQKLFRIQYFIAYIFLIPINLSAQDSKPVSIIFDSDMGPDYDDVGAIALLHALADSGKVDILATVASTKYEGVAAVFDVFNTYFNRPDIPIGVPKGEAPGLRDGQHWSDTVLRKYPHSIQRNADVPDAVEVYRKTLAAAPDQSVIIVTVGFLTNLSNLIQSKPDKYSQLNGMDLIRKKVKQLVSMAGWFPHGKEFNVHIDASSSRIVFENWNTPVLFSGGEVGMKIKTGLPLIQNKFIKHSPVKDVFSICIPMNVDDAKGRSSWDETAVLVAIKGHHPFYTIQSGKIVVAADGSNTWDQNAKGHHYLVENLPIEVVQKTINNLIMHQPKKK